MYDRVECVVTASSIGRISVCLTLDPKTVDNSASPTMYATGGSLLLGLAGSRAFHQAATSAHQRQMK